MFNKFSFSLKQVHKYYQSAIRDLNIAQKSNIPEVSFRFSYDALLKLAITVCAKNGLRVNSRQSHHIELIKKLSQFLTDEEIEVLGNDMRSKRNWDLYDGGVLISIKETKEYLGWIESIFKKADGYLELNKHKLF